MSTMRSRAALASLLAPPLVLAGCATATEVFSPATPAGSSRAAAAAVTHSGDTSRDGRTWPVLRVVDGDTVHVRYRGRDITIRIIGIDTAETVSPTVPDECGGPAASRMAHRILDGQRVRVIFDPSQGRHDKYGRTLAYLEVPGVGDYGQAMIRKGLAAEYTYDTPYARRATYQRAQDAARAAQRGTWGHCGGFDTPLHSSTGH